MKTIRYLVFIWALVGVVAVVSLGAEGRWELIEKDGSHVWQKGEKEVPAIAPELDSKLSKRSRIKIKQDSSIRHAVMVLPGRSVEIDGKKVAGIILLKPGKSADTLLDLAPNNRDNVKLNKDIVDVKLHRQGFFFSTVIASSVFVCTYQKGSGVSVISQVPVGQIRNKRVKISFSSKMATIEKQEETSVFDTEGLPIEAANRFHDLTPTNIDSLLEDFKAIDITAKVKEHRVKIVPYYSDRVERVARNFSANGRSSVVLVDETVGTQSSQVVYQLAAQIVQGERKIFGEPGWKIFEVNWSRLGSEGYVDRTVEKVNKLFDLARRKKVILYVPSLDSLKDLGVTKRGETRDATSAMQQDLDNGHVIVIGQVNPRGLNNLRTRASEFLQSFAEVRVEPPSDSQLREILAKEAKTLQRRYDVAFSPKVIGELIRLGNQYISNEREAQPKKSLDMMLAIARDPGAFGDVSSIEEDDDGNLMVHEDMIKEYVAEVAGIKTLGKSGRQALSKFLEPENYYKVMRKRVVGQETALKAIYRKLLLLADDNPLEAGESGALTGVPLLMFLGSSGTGKSFFPEMLAGALEDANVTMPHLPLELSTAFDDHMAAIFSGSPAGYVGFTEEGSKFFRGLQEHPQAILVLEEFDKPPAGVLKPLYPFLENGRFQDAHLNSIRWTNGIVFLTSNFGAQGDGLIDSWDMWKMGKEPLHKEVIGWTEEDLKHAVIRDLERSKKLSPQIIGRIGMKNIIIMHHFDEAEIRELIKRFKRIVISKFSKSKENMKDGQPLYQVRFDSSVEPFLFKESWGLDGAKAFNHGARAPKDLILSHVYSMLLEKLRSRPEGSTLVVVGRKGEIVVEVE